MPEPRRLLFSVRSAIDGHIRGREQLDDHWEVVYEFATRDGALAMRELRIVPISDDLPPTPPRAAALRKRLRPAEVLGQARQVMLENVTPEVLSGFHGLASQKVAQPGGRQRRPDYWYAAIAAHVEMAANSGSTRPRVDAAKALGPGWDVRAIRDALSAAKARGLWNPAQQGTRTGGRLSDLGAQVLAAGPPDGYSGQVVASPQTTAIRDQ